MSEIRTLPALLDEMATRHPDAAAVLSDTGSLAFSELRARSARVAAALSEARVGPGDRVGLLACNGTQWLEVCFGTLMAGATLVPFSTWSTRDELSFLLADSGVCALFAMAEFDGRDFAADLDALIPGRGADARTVVMLDAAPYEAFLASAPGAGATTALDPAGDALVLYTSGSSSRPKAVRLRHGDLVENGYNIGERQGLREGDRVYLPTPLFWAFGSSNALPAAFGHGAALVLQRKFDAGGALDAIERHRCTAIYTLPSITAALLRHPGFSPARTASLRTGVSIGSPQDIVMVAERLGARDVCNIYGLTETYGNCCVTDHRWPLERRARCQGEPLPGVTVRILDQETGEEAPRGTAGLVEVKGFITPGYSGASAAENDATFTADGFFRTGDLGLLTPENEFVFVGRGSEIIKRGGINVSPVEIEEILLQHPKVSQTGVVGVPDAEMGELVVAFVVPVHAAALVEQELKEHCRRVASKYKTPDRILLRDTLPTTVTGKLMRRQLKAEAADLVADDSRLKSHAG